jgi:tetratricopeptide (TPR) repeat protein
VGVRIPKRVGRIGELSTWSGGPFPPSGFAAFEDHALGNGDTFGLYWPIGHEDREPLVVEAVLVAGSLVPAFSSLDRFLKLAADVDEAEHVEWPDLEADARAPHACLQAARAALAEKDFATAMKLLQRALDMLPEYAAALSLLSFQHLRRGDQAEACRLAVRAVRAPPSFAGEVDVGRSWSWLARQAEGPDDLAGDPIWIGRAALASPPRGGAKADPTYEAMAEAIAAYEAEDQVVAALNLLQAYGEYMWRETVAFQARYGFSEASHGERRRALEARLPAGSRSVG